MKSRNFLTALLLCMTLTACGTSPAPQSLTETETYAVLTESPTETESETSPTEIETETEPEIPFDYTICFTGDISVADDARTTSRWIAHGRDTSSCFDETILQHMRDADICFADNEFPYSTRGSATPNKDYTYRADPENVQLMLDLGVDIAALANNHMYDYGPDALLDTLDTLDKAHILHVGAGKNLEDASRTVFVELDGLKVAFLNGSRVEWAELTKGATADSPGVFRTVDPELLYQRVEEAKQEADLVLVYMHWGIESVEYLEDYQKEVGKGLVDHGADAVIGDHTHCLQGIEYYQNAPIIYSLGNFWFNGKTQRTTLAELHIKGTRSDHTLQLQYLPAMQDGCAVYCITDPDAQSAYYRYLESISPNCVFDADGNCAER